MRTSSLALPLAAALALLLAACGTTDTIDTATPATSTPVETPATEPAAVVPANTPTTTPATAGAAPATEAAVATPETDSIAPAAQATTEPSASIGTGTTYTASEWFMTPGGPHTMGVNVTVADGKITAISTTNDAEDEASVYYYDSFTKELGGSIVGKTIAQAAETGRIGGASLCTGALKDALTTIDKQAQAAG